MSILIWILIISILSFFAIIGKNTTCPAISDALTLDRARLAYYPTTSEVTQIPFTQNTNGVEMFTGGWAKTVKMPDASLYKDGSYFYVVNDALLETTIDSTNTDPLISIPVVAKSANIFKVSGNKFIFKGSMDIQSFRNATLSFGTKPVASST
jgi:hypothetical protein